MRDRFHRLLPWVSGAALGWLWLHPPAWLQLLGPLSYLVHGALCAVLLLGLVSFMIASNLPAKLEMTPVRDHVPSARVREVCDELARLGFRPAGPPKRVNVAPSAVLHGFVHESLPIYGSAFETETKPSRLGYDLVSILHDDRGGLTTSANPEGAVLPAGDGGLRQVFTGADVGALYEKHLDGIAYLRQRGLAVRPVSAEMLERDFALGMAYQRAIFTGSPLRSTLVTLWRAATKRVPFLGPLREQAAADSQIHRLLRP